MPFLTTNDLKGEEAWSSGEGSWGVLSVEREFIETRTEYAHLMANRLVMPRAIKVAFSAKDDDILFVHLVSQWHVERGATSSVSEMVECPSYREIIRMGEKALPLIMAQIRRKADDPDHWFAALEAITGEDPVPEAVYGDTVKMAEAWLAWAEEGNVE